MVTCVAYGCQNRTSKKRPQLTFHRFPKDAARRALWVKAVHRKNWAPQVHSFICSDHFTEDCFDRSSCLRVSLQEYAVPSVFPAFPEHLQKKVHNFKQRHEIEYKKRHAQKVHNWLDSSEIKKESRDTVFVEQLLSNLCRICARSCDGLVAIFGEKAMEQELITKIHSHLPITVTAEDDLPLYMCEDCIKNLDICHGLVKACRDADTSFKLMLGLPTSKQKRIPAVLHIKQPKKQAVPEKSVGTQTQPLYVLAPALPQKKELEGQNATPNCPPPCMLVTEDVLLQMMVNEKSNGQRVNEAPAKGVPLKQVTVNWEAAAKQCSNTGVKPRSVISAAPSLEAGGESSSKLSYCDACDLRFGDEEKYLKHMARNQCTYECSHCVRNFPDKSQKDAHERLHTKEKPFVCGTCDKAFGNMGLLRRHMDVHNNRTFACKECDRVYNNRSGLYWHRWTHRNATYTCPVCGEQVRKGSRAYAHRRKHANICRKCGQKFNDGKLLEAHEKTIHKLCPNDCNCCLKKPKKSPSVSLTRPKESLNVSLKKPKKSRHVSLSCIDMWKCAFCPRALKTLQSLEAHMAQKHKYKCFDCMQFFKDEEELRAHKQAQCREGDASSPLEPNGYSGSESLDDLDLRSVKCRTIVYVPCDVCGKVFSDKDRHERHEIKCASLRCFRCPICGKGLPTKHRLLVHKQVHASQKLYRCISCGKRFTFLNCLKKHCIISHPVSLNLLRSFSIKLENVWK